MDRDGGIYAAQKADLLLKFFEGYYVEKYPMDKMDSAAVPAFFFGGALIFLLHKSIFKNASVYQISITIHHLSALLHII